MRYFYSNKKGVIVPGIGIIYIEVRQNGQFRYR